MQIGEYQNPASIARRFLQSAITPPLSGGVRTHNVCDLAHLIDATLNEFRANEGSGLEMIPDELLTRLLAEIRDANRAYRSEFRAGIGDEVALIADMRGEVPPLPGISEDTVKNANAPRFLIVRPVIDRKQLEKAGESLVATWKNLSALGAEQLGGTQAAILPQAIESGQGIYLAILLLSETYKENLELSRDCVISPGPEFWNDVNVSKQFAFPSSTPWRVFPQPHPPNETDPIRHPECFG